MRASQFYDWLYWLMISNAADDKERRKIDREIEGAEREGFFDWSALDGERPAGAPSWYTSDEQAGEEGLALLQELGLPTGA